MKKKYIAIGIFAFLFIAIITYCFSWFFSKNTFLESVRTTRGMEISPDKKYVATIKSTSDEPNHETLKTLIGSSYTANVKIIIQEYETDKQLAVIDTSTQSDVSIGHGDNGIGFQYNWSVFWQDASVKIILKDNQYQDKVCIVPLQ